MTENKKKGKLFGVLSLLDLFIIVIIVGAAVFGIFYIKSGGFKSGERTTVYYTVEITAMTNGFHEVITEGDALKDSVKGYYLGQVADVAVKPNQVWIINEDNFEFIHNTVENEEMILLTISGRGMESDSLITCEDIDVKIGKEMHVEGKGYVVRGFIVDIWTEQN